jgi:hypothetical protein
MEQINKKYPKSLSGKQCAGPCYKKNTKIIHPLYLHVVTDLDNSFCPVAEYYENKYAKHIDRCNDNIQKTDLKTNDMELIYPNLDFNSESFLDIFYNIKNFNEGINWISENIHTPIDTRERIFNLIFDAFNKQVDIIEISDNRIIDFVNILIKNKYSQLLSKIFKYIDINDKFVIMKESYPIKKETDETIIIKTNYIIKNLITYENITNFISKFVRTKVESSIIKSYSEIMIDKFIVYLIDNIKKTISK